eukprot:CAMPEP_0202486504 /NCGR_PEP_ID=MMETSP1361-20130828/5068_1 /ASSEMBLY_ACC=CAM_ASM_000849 /TAXON_ID=210615 /ORGANISM="Staurosira complex sp., Strain CCMP2646" /LENGTH=199 /DNA_ID=CAMNT_0049115681 /DNA_START=109 /DNA_END=708 /DNA_ORIENTATION=+
MSDDATAALVHYLRIEADLSELKAQRLTQQADQLALEHGLQGTELQILDASEMAPLDEFGIPKYRGKKRGRKPKPRQRHHNPNRKKRSHTAYTLFVQENYPGVRAEYPILQSKDIIGMVARQWSSITDEEKKAWKQRATATTRMEQDEDENNGQDDDEEEETERGHFDEDETEEEEEEEEEESTSEPPKKKRGRPKKVK